MNTRSKQKVVCCKVTKFTSHLEQGKINKIVFLF